MVDVMVRAEDASKINRIVERFHLATVDTASIKHDIEQSRAEKSTAPTAPEQSQPVKSEEDRLLDDLLGAPVQKEESPNPTAAKTEKSPPSAPTSEMPSRAAEGTVKKAKDRPSVRQELREIKAARQVETETAPNAPETGKSAKNPAQKTNQHKQPKHRKKNKSKVR